MIYTIHDFDLGYEERFDTLEDFKKGMLNRSFQFREDEHPEYNNFIKQYKEWKQQVDNATADNIVPVANEFLNLFDYDAGKYED